MPDLTIRPLDAGELHLFDHYADPPASGVGVRSRPFHEYVAEGQCRPGWAWVALRGTRVVARAAFWLHPATTTRSASAGSTRVPARTASTWARPCCAPRTPRS